MATSPNFDDEQLRRWRLVLGKDSQESLGNCGSCNLSGEDSEMDEALAAIYDETGDEGQGQKRSGGIL